MKSTRWWHETKCNESLHDLWTGKWESKDPRLWPYFFNVPIVWECVVLVFQRSIPHLYEYRKKSVKTNKRIIAAIHIKHWRYMRQQTASPIHGMHTLVYAASVGRIATVRHVIGSFFTILPARHYRLNYVFRIDSLSCFNPSHYEYRDIPRVWLPR